MRSLGATALAALLAGLAVIPAAVAQDDDVVAIVGATVLTVGPSGSIENGTVILRDGKITAVGAGVAVPDGARVVDATGRFLTPGIIDTHSHMGVYPWPSSRATSDGNEATSPITPEVRAADSVHVEDPAFALARAGGVTTIMILPGSANLIGGEACIIKLRVFDEFDIQPRVLHHALEAYKMRDELARRRIGISTWADWWGFKVEAYDGIPHNAALCEAAGVNVVIHSDSSTDVQRLWHEASKCLRFGLSEEAALRLRDEFDLRIAIVRGAEAWKLADRLAAADVPVILGPVTQSPNSVETLGARSDGAAILTAAGVRVALTTADTHNARNLPYQAGLAMANGLSERDALRAITLTPAEILGVADQVGALRAGATADVIVLDGSVVQPRTRVLRMWIGGREVELTSRQTELADQHR